MELELRRRAIMASKTPSAEVFLRFLSEGTLIYIEETGAYYPYIYLGTDEYNNPRVLRQDISFRRRQNDTRTASYGGNEIDTYLGDASTGFLSVLTSPTRGKLINTNIKYTDYNQSGDGTVQILTIARKCFLLSYSEAGYGDSPAGNEGKSYLDALKTFYNTTDGHTARIATYNGTATGYWMRSAINTKEFRYVYSTGGAGFNYANLGNIGVRPALSFDPNATAIFNNGNYYI